jgi:hypothetical protein
VRAADLNVPTWVRAATIIPPALIVLLCFVGIFYCRFSKWLVSIDPPRPNAKYLFTVQ